MTDVTLASFTEDRAAMSARQKTGPPFPCTENGHTSAIAMAQLASRIIIKADAGQSVGAVAGGDRCVAVAKRLPYRDQKREDSDETEVYHDREIGVVGINCRVEGSTHQSADNRPRFRRRNQNRISNCRLSPRWTLRPKFRCDL